MSFCKLTSVILFCWHVHVNAFRVLPFTNQLCGPIQIPKKNEWFQNGCNKVVIELRVVQFWSEIILVISNRTRALRSRSHTCDFRPNCTPLSSITIINKTLSCIWVAVLVDWVILHWYDCGADGRSLARCTVTWLSNFLGRVDYILGDRWAVSRVVRKGAKRQEESFLVRAREPLGTDSHRPISKNSSRCCLLIGHKKCFVLLCPVGEQFLLSNFREFIHDGYNCLATLARFVHQACACKGNFYFLLS